MKQRRVSNMIVVIICTALTSQSKSQTWNVGVTGSGQFEVRIKPAQIMEDVEVLLTLTHNDNRRQEVTVPFTDDQYKFLQPGKTYRKTYHCSNTVKRVEGRDTYFNFEVAGGGENMDRTRPRLGPSTSASLPAQGAIALPARTYQSALVVTTMSFNGWEEVPGAVTTDEAPAICEVNNTIYLFSKGLSDNGVYMNVKRAGAWTGATLIPGLKTNSSLSAVHFGNRIFLFARSEANYCFFNIAPATIQNVSEWQGWQEFPGNIKMALPVHAATLGNYLYVFGKTLDNNQISYNRLTVKDGWIGWTKVPVHFSTNVPIASALDPTQSRLWLFVKDQNDKIYYSNLTVNRLGYAYWANYWQVHPVIGSTRGALTATHTDRRIFLFARGTSNKVFHSQFSPSHDLWTNWRAISNERPTDKDIVITGRDLSTITLFCKDISSNSIFMNRRTP